MDSNSKEGLVYTSESYISCLQAAVKVQEQIV